ncbi:nucleotide sugar dehydrogenase [Xylanibacillus composti]|uniref:UDP-N-acetyl-D-galactosamine dehydrogenase n=1 Tax=Xylanibacillus composti TaxID=1572762 RepID=A0A8J4H6T4_9BACL|nr:nucleotide sugar dehydrogenase [Xylanibacillus composti]MDT9726884.1 nucleotide sugar dehydrogenase [Xylanibacillus composti]GIQ69803.1 UDP-N-acetyl-D-galactosamine dehydrogenase [Xylanibacillus composti]
MRLMNRLLEGKAKLAVIGLGYVGLPLALAFAKRMPVIGFDVDKNKIERYRNGKDVTGSLGDDALRDNRVDFTEDESRLAEASVYVVTVPTPIRSGNVPDLRFVESASRMVGRSLAPGALVIYESTVYPGVTEEICIPILERESGLRFGEDFKVGYSPERINPGDREHELATITKVVSGSDEEALAVVAKLYASIIEAGVYRAESIRVAEAAKVIENAQRDINIAFMNELSMLFHRMGLDTHQVLQAAATKWNFLPFRPGLVGGHCIGIDPYYLTYKAEDSGYLSKIILAGRQINEGMGVYVAQQVIKELVRLKLNMEHVRIAILGLTYKENCPDIRNSKVRDIVRELADYGIEPTVVDPLADREQAAAEYGIRLSELSSLKNMNAVIVAVPHDAFQALTVDDFEKMYDQKHAKLMVDVRGTYAKESFTERHFHYWRL